MNGNYEKEVIKIKSDQLCLTVSLTNENMEYFMTILTISTKL